MDRIGVIFVCLGNICRSPMAKGLFEAKVAGRNLSARFDVDSAGTSAYHVGEAPDPGSVRAAAQAGVDISADRARRATRADFERFDYVIALDRHNYRDLVRLAPEHEGRIHLLRSFEASADGLDVPDPWGEGYRSFVLARDIIDRATAGLLDHLVTRHSDLEGG